MGWFGGVGGGVGEGVGEGEGLGEGDTSGGLPLSRAVEPSCFPDEGRQRLEGLGARQDGLSLTGDFKLSERSEKGVSLVCVRPT